MSKFLNVSFQENRQQIDVTKLVNLSQVRIVIKAVYDTDLGFPSSRVQLFADDGKLVEDLDDIPEAYYLPRDGARFLEIIEKSPPFKSSKTTSKLEPLTTKIEDYSLFSEEPVLGDQLKFLNVCFDEAKTAIDVTKMEDLGEVCDAIKALFPTTINDPGRVQLFANGNLVKNLKSISEAYYLDPEQPDARFLEISEKRPSGTMASKTRVGTSTSKLEPVTTKFQDYSLFTEEPVLGDQTKFLNICFDGAKTRINVTNMVNLGQVRLAIKTLFQFSFAAPYVELKADGNLVKNLKSISEAYYLDPSENLDALFLEISEKSPTLKTSKTRVGTSTSKLEPFTTKFEDYSLFEASQVLGEQTKFLNVCFNGAKTAINVIKMEDWSQVQLAIKRLFQFPFAAPCIELKAGGNLVEYLEDIPEAYYLDPEQPDARFLEISEKRPSGTMSSKTRVGISTSKLEPVTNKIEDYSLFTEEPGFGDQTKFLNVCFDEAKTAINVIKMEDLSEVCDAIKAKFPITINDPGRVQLKADGILVEYLEDIPEAYYLSRYGARFLEISEKYPTFKSNKALVGTSTSKLEPVTTKFEDYSLFTEEQVLGDQTLIEFNDAGKKPRPSFCLYPTQSIASLKDWVVNSILCSDPARHVAAINGFTKTGKSTLARSVLPSFIKSVIAESEPFLDFKLAFVSFEFAKRKENAFGITKSFIGEMYHKAIKIGLVVDPAICDAKSLRRASENIKTLMKAFHAFAIKHKIRVLFVWDEVQRFFQVKGQEYQTLAELFKWICVGDSTWSNFFFVLTGGMTMAWRGFKASSDNAFPTDIANINIESNNDLQVKTYVYEKFKDVCGYDVPQSTFMNPACIVLHCRTFADQRGSMSRDKCTAEVEKKLTDEICEDLVPLLQELNRQDLETLYLLAFRVCSIKPTAFLESTRSFFDQFLKVYDTSDPKVVSHTCGFFEKYDEDGEVEEVELPPFLYGLGEYCPYIAYIFMLVQPNGTLNQSLLRSWQV